nr:unnamed protein product [Callosobruchus chinensis]
MYFVEVCAKSERRRLGWLLWCARHRDKKRFHFPLEFLRMEQSKFLKPPHGDQVGYGQIVGMTLRLRTKESLGKLSCMPLIFHPAENSIIPKLDLLLMRSQFKAMFFIIIPTLAAETKRADLYISRTTEHRHKKEGHVVSENRSIITKKKCRMEKAAESTLVTVRCYSVSINFTIAVEHLDKLKDTIEKFRTDEHFRVVLSEASQLGQSLGVEDNFPIEGDVRRRKKKKQFDYEAEDENISCPENNFRINFFFEVLDTTIKLYQKDFSNLRLTNMGTILKDGLKNFCIELESKLSDGNDENCKRDVVEYVLKNNHSSMFTNLKIALRIMLSLPVTIASGERSFSSLKCIKNYLRTSMSRIIIYREYCCESLHMKDIIKEFASIKSQNVDLF